MRRVVVISARGRLLTVVSGTTASGASLGCSVLHHRGRVVAAEVAVAIPARGDRLAPP